MAHVWVVEVRDRDTTRPGGWTAWRMLETPRHEFAFSRRVDARDKVRERKRYRMLGTEYRAARYDRREP